MTLLSFAFSPVFCLSWHSVLFCAAAPIQKNTQQTYSIDLNMFFVCFLYPLTKVYLTGSYNIFDNFYLFCFLSSLIAIAINIGILTVIGVKNERN